MKKNKYAGNFVSEVYVKLENEKVFSFNKGCCRRQRIRKKVRKEKQKIVAHIFVIYYYGERERETITVGYCKI